MCVCVCVCVCIYRTVCVRETLQSVCTHTGRPVTGEEAACLPQSVYLRKDTWVCKSVPLSSSLSALLLFPVFCFISVLITSSPVSCSCFLPSRCPFLSLFTPQCVRPFLFLLLSLAVRLPFLCSQTCASQLRMNIIFFLDKKCPFETEHMSLTTNSFEVCLVIISFKVDCQFTSYCSCLTFCCLFKCLISFFFFSEGGRLVI